ncbi:hypothetical protein HW561_16075 [Rhodobacteraceae bacterium B1Z28]|uniref:Flp pilus assembly pilin Flp n=1 Tax=Ruegeria haliotis TaxID=2747601 RepID=A0ABX2PT20_9RHOB|nr:hypothetical protein [Ruegeria haliotis]NVO57312.1 hypothetical protein [Ruegeria haliotis]
MFRFLKNFHTKDDGAVTVDWVVLTALIIGLGAALFFAIQNATNSFSGNVNTALTTATISTGDNDTAGGVVSAGTAGGSGSSSGGSGGGSSSGGSSGGSGG